MLQVAIQFQGGLRDNQYNLEIGLYPVQLTLEERDDYTNFVRNLLYKPPNRGE